MRRILRRLRPQWGLAFYWKGKQLSGPEEQPFHYWTEARAIRAARSMQIQHVDMFPRSSREGLIEYKAVRRG